MSRKIPTLYIASYDGKSKKLASYSTYTHASVVRWSTGRITVGYRWAASETAARNCLTEEQSWHGAEVVAVVPAVAQWRKVPFHSTEGDERG